MKVVTKEGKTVDLFARNVCIACELGAPHDVKQNKWCKVKTKRVSKEVRK